MNIDKKQMKGKPRKVAKLHGKDVFHVETKGGLHLLTCPGEKNSTLGVGPHVVLARHTARKHAPDLVWTALDKSDFIPPEHYQHLLPKYESLLEALRNREGR